MTEKPEINPEIGGNSRLPGELPPVFVVEPKKPIVWGHDPRVDDPKEPREPGPHDIERVIADAVDGGAEDPVRKLIVEGLWESTKGWISDRKPLTRGAIVIGSVVLAVGILKSCDGSEGADVPIATPPVAASETFQSTLEKVVLRNPKLPLFTNVKLANLTDPNTANRVGLQKYEIKMKCSETTTPVIVFLGQNGSDVGHFQRVDPSELNSVAVENLEARRLKYEQSLELNSGVDRTPAELSEEDLSSVILPIGRTECNIANLDELHPVITSQRVIIAEEAGPVDQGGGGNVGWGKVLIVLASVGVLTIVGRIKQIKKSFS